MANNVVLVWLDWPLNAPLKAIAGVVRDEDSGVPVSGYRVELFREVDDLFIDFRTSALDGSYSFSRGGDDPYTYYVVATNVAGDYHGTSDHNLVPA